MIIFLSGDSFFQLSRIVSEFLVLAMIDVDMIANWQLVLLIQSYVVATRFGILNSFNRDYPYYLSSKNKLKSEQILSTTSFHVRVSLVIQSLIFFLGFVYSFIFIENLILSISLLVGSLYTVIEGFINFSESRLKAELKFYIITKIRLLSIFIIFISLIFPYYFEYKGLLIRVIIIQSSILLLFILYSRRYYNKNRSWKIWLELFYKGWKIWLGSYIKNVNKSLPKLYLVSFSTLTTLGFYTPVHWMISSLSIITSSFGSYIYPNLLKRYSKGKKDIVKITFKLNFIMFLISIPVSIITYFLIPLFVKFLIPEYALVITPMRIAVIASTFEVFNITSTAWVVVDKLNRMAYFIFLSLIIRLFSLLWVYMFNNGEILLYLSYSLLINSIGIMFLSMIFIIIEKYYAK